MADEKDILHLQKKDEEPRLTIETFGHITVFVVENTNIYPKQAQGLSQTMKEKAGTLARPSSAT